MIPMKFNFADDVKALGINGMYFIISGMKNRKADDGFQALLNTYLESLNPSDIKDKIETSNIIRGFRDAHDAVNCSGKKYISSPENLYSFFVTHNSLPNINLIVDIYNYISFCSELAIGAHDTQFICGDIDLRLTAGTEHFWPLGYSKPIPIKPGEYCYIDGSNDILCRLEVRQVEKTKVTENTVSCFYIVQGNRETPSSLIVNTAKKLIDLTKMYCGGEVTYLYEPLS